jgi:hypothetical protein
MEKVRTAFQQLLQEQHRAEKRLGKYEKPLAKGVKQPGLTDDSLLSELQGLVGRRARLKNRPARDPYRDGHIRVLAKVPGTS